MSKARIAVAGAGIAGLAAALLLKRCGHAVTIFERFEKPAPLGSGLIIQPTGQMVLGELGLLDEAEGLSSRLTAIRGHDAITGRPVLDVSYASLGGGGYGLGIGRGVLFGVLFDATRRAGIEVVTDTRVDAVRQVLANSYRLVSRGKTIGIDFDLVIDATGTGSQLRRQFFPRREPRPNAYGALWTSLDFHEDGFDLGALAQRYDKASVMIGVLPTGRDHKGGPQRAAFFWSQKPGGYDALRGGGLQAWKDRVAAYWPQTTCYLDQIRDWDQLTLARYGHHTLPEPFAPGLAFIGDAAHSTSPQLGQGANMALLDALALDRALAQYANIDQALSEYGRMRRLHVRLFQFLSATLTPFYQSDSAVFPFVRDRLAAVAARVPPGPKLLAGMVAGTLGWPDHWMNVSSDRVTSAA